MIREIFIYIFCFYYYETFRSSSVCLVKYIKNLNFNSNFKKCIIIIVITISVR